jgi:hypothetical protein
MERAIVSRKTLDALIRAKLVTLEECPHVEALPVTWSNGHNGHGCNWTIPGWVGDAGVVNRCLEKLEHYLDFLRDQFNIPTQGDGVAD